MTHKRGGKTDFISRVIAWRKAKGLSQAEAAEELKINKRTLQDWEMRRHKPRLESIEGVFLRLERDGF